jgi:hypothetical protein
MVEKKEGDHPPGAAAADLCYTLHFSRFENFYLRLYFQSSMFYRQDSEIRAKSARFEAVSASVSGPGFGPFCPLALANSPVPAHDDGTPRRDNCPFHQEAAPMPRKSAAQLAAEERLAGLPGGKLDRPDPPEGMPEAAAAVWRAAVSSMKPRHFTKETHAMLARYCRAMAICEELEAELLRIGLAHPDYDGFLKRLNSTAAVALAYARGLRLTPKSHVETRGNARDPHRLMGPRPWERDYEPGGMGRRLWDKDDKTKPS